MARFSDTLASLVEQKRSDGSIGGAEMPDHAGREIVPSWSVFCPDGAAGERLPVLDDHKRLRRPVALTGFSIRYA
jgi:hypothetical protein